MFIDLEKISIHIELILIYLEARGGHVAYIKAINEG